MITTTVTCSNVTGKASPEGVEPEANDGVDNDGDYRVDEELLNSIDDDGDGLIDEDTSSNEYYGDNRVRSQSE